MTVELRLRARRTPGMAGDVGDRICRAPGIQRILESTEMEKAGLKLRAESFGFIVTRG